MTGRLSLASLACGLLIFPFVAASASPAFAPSVKPLPSGVLPRAVASRVLSSGKSSTVDLEFQPSNEGPKRTHKISVKYTEYDWWLAEWSDNGILCSLSVDHEGPPTTGEVFKACGSTLATQWSKTGPCNLPPDHEASCPGLYVHLAGTAKKERTVEVELPPAQAWITLAGCPPTPPGGACPTIPSLQIDGVEPLPNEKIVGVHATKPDGQWNCDADTCLVPLWPTGPDGDELTFWAESSLGDTSARYTARVRVVSVDPGSCRDGCGWYVDVLSSQLRNDQPLACARVWDSLPPAGGPPEWLTTPTSVSDLASTEPYALLGGKLIAAGAVDVSDCPSGGLLPEGTPDGCGMAKAKPLIDAWQDRFDDRILTVATSTGIPAMLLKRVFAQESQFWPGSLGEAQEFGLGRLTDEGADATLLWNKPFFDDFCPLVLDAGVCAAGYAQLNETHRAMLRGALILRAQTDCPTCNMGVDLSQADLSVQVFADALLANCGQVGRMVFNTTHATPGKETSYEDLWRITLANYNVGPGCVSSAMKKAWMLNGSLDWQGLASQLSATCKRGVDYVDRITRSE